MTKVYQNNGIHICIVKASTVLREEGQPTHECQLSWEFS